MSQLENKADLFTAVDKSLPEVAIVILNWNGKDYLQKFLPSVLTSDYKNKRVMVADNGSTDDSIVFLQHNFPTVEIIINETNEGFAKGYNSALKKVQSDYYVLLNSDVEVTTNWIQPVIDLMEADKMIGACQPKILSYQQKDKFEYAGAGGGWMDHFGYPFARGRIFEFCETDQGQYDNAEECFWASGAAMFIRSKIYHDLIGLDEYFFAHQEEIDLCWRAQLEGYKIYIQPASVVYHVGGGTLPRGNSRKAYLNFRNNLIMLFKNLPWHRAIWIIPIRLALDGVAAWKSLFAGNGSLIIPVTKAHVNFVGWILFHQKKSVFAKSKNKKISGWYKGSVVWDHFVKHKKTFLEIIGNK